MHKKLSQSLIGILLVAIVVIGLAGMSQSVRADTPANNTTNSSDDTVDTTPINNTITTPTPVSNTDTTDSLTVSDPTSVSSVTVTVDAKSNSATLKWQAITADSYTIRFGTDAENLSNTIIVPKTQTSANLSPLPPGQKIYFELTPNLEGIAGTTYKGNFQVPASSSNFVLIIMAAGAVVVIVIIGFLIKKLFGRRKQLPAVQPGVNYDLFAASGLAPNYTTPPPAPNVYPTTLPPASPVTPVTPSSVPAPLSSNNPSLPQPVTTPTTGPVPLNPEIEKQMLATLESLKSRSRWWLPDSSAQQIAANQAAQSAKDALNIPDMYAEGRKRLEAEEKDNLIPKY